MSSLLPFVSKTFTRTKRKMSSMDKPGSLDEIELSKSISLSPLSSTSTASLSPGSGGVRNTVTIKWCELCATVDPREIAGFVVFEALIVFLVALGCLDWIFFFKFIVEPEDFETRAKWGSVWVVYTMSFVYFRSLVRSKWDPAMRYLGDHAEIFICVSMVMVFGTNVAFLLHTPGPALRDLGFMLIPAQAVDSKWRPLSDILTAAIPVIFLIQAHLMKRENRCRVMTTFFRCATICYGLRMCTISLTSLPGPAPHCRPGNPDYFPPQNWIDVVTRIGPMYGNYNSCGDLIFSGHMAYTTTAVLLYLRVLDRNIPRFSRVRWTLGVIYLFVLAGLCVSGRKHYTVDVVLGSMISALVFFHFEHGWTPYWVHASSPAMIAARQGYVQPDRYATKRFSMDTADDDEALDEYDDNDVLLAHNRESKKLNPVEFIC
ncbi:hypothetical protein Poli38472_013424 [Pythium oligandrum]|uniref:Sphingomyelin synthase-like domain-containing protein n=1 Tax=Pythium oligandrum TaxID=41045 RepID=A0A8K1C7Z4_PYTOL|nr:hypothetical protein Poli38472_013424 [Pythium oligandrum]|eukprot:TMW57950.1 hypothetical protein Poli38472_013424 [Pythium oligandrum]